MLLIKLDVAEARIILVEALELSDSNPLVARAYALYLLTSCEAPIGPNREKAMSMIKDAERRDATASKFALATSIAKYACYREPRNAKVLLNLALIEVLVNKNIKNSERLFRRCLAIAPFEEAVLENWKFLKDKFPDEAVGEYLPASKTAMVNTNKGSKKRMIQGRPAVEDPAWAGWVYVEPSSDLYFVSSKADIAAAAGYWYNPSTGEKRLEEYTPDFAQEWQMRMARSVFKSEKLGLEYYFDPITSTYWQYHRMTNTYQ